MLMGVTEAGDSDGRWITPVEAKGTNVRGTTEKPSDDPTKDMIAIKPNTVEEVVGNIIAPLIRIEWPSFKTLRS